MDVTAAMGVFLQSELTFQGLGLSSRTVAFPLQYTQTEGIKSPWLAQGKSSTLGSVVEVNSPSA